MGSDARSARVSVHRCACLHSLCGGGVGASQGRKESGILDGLAEVRRVGESHESMASSSSARPYGSAAAGKWRCNWLQGVIDVPPAVVTSHSLCHLESGVVVHRLPCRLSFPASRPLLAAEGARQERNSRSKDCVAAVAAIAHQSFFYNSC